MARSFLPPIRSRFSRPSGAIDQPDLRGSSVVDWKGDPKRFIRYSLANSRSRQLFLASNQTVKFRNMTLTPLTAASP